MLGRNLFNAVRGAPGISLLGRAKKLVHCTDAPSLKKNDSGIPATPEQARQHLRYAVAMKTAYAGNQTRFSSTGGYREDLAKNRKELLPYLRSPDTLSFEQKSKLIENDEVYYPPKVQKSEKKEYRAAIEKKYALRHKMYTKTWRKEAGFRSVDPVGDHQHVEAWAFEAIGEHPGRHLNPEAEAIYDG